MSDFYQLTNSTSDFKSRSNDIFDKLSNLEKQHDTHTKTNTPISAADDETPSSSTYQNPNIPSHAITFKKRPADDTTFTRPTNKWKKYDLEDVNEHHLSNMGNQHALNDFLRTHVKPSETNEIEEEIPSKAIFKRPIKKQILTNDDDNDHDHLISICVPTSSNTIETKTENDNNNDDDDDGRIEYKLKSIRKQHRGVLSTNEKKSIKPSIELLQEKDNEDNDDDEEDVNDELFEP